MTKQHVVAIVQARMGSSRLPGKVLKPLGNKPLIILLLERLKQCKQIDEIVLATSTNPENDELCHVVSHHGFNTFRGDEDDVLGRFYQCAVTFNATDIVRITGDSPLLSPEICDTLINDYFRKQADYAYLSEHFAEGVDCEVLSFQALSVAHVNAKLASQREHVTLYVYQNESDFTIIELANSQDDSHYRFTVDNEEDYQVVGQIIEHCDDLSLNYQEIKHFLDENPIIKKMNQHIVRNEGLITSLQNDQRI
ncbi:spore coat protein [Thalassotalea loyana]|uniref:Spore coat protein n=1 Tax=Thalassotalea loyana TaxID=280483 RepID=A0ABQ6HCN9_9GAMM|nr:glycosyltransferase family protein [Thalassotalea loyana]GLX84661.1 spore coat protein [Thalassotalea loyana]